MSALEAYTRDGFVHLAQFLPTQVANSLLFQLREDFREMNVDWKRIEKQHDLLARPAAEVYGYHYAPLITFLWGMTPAISALLERPLLPTYCYFRLYRQGDICRVHSDRPACQHSLSLTLAYSDDRPWALEMGSESLLDPQPTVVDGFGAEAATGVAMAAGDAVLYQGVHRRHGRTTPNPNRWSAHLFLHWVEPDGPFADRAFDGRGAPPKSMLGF